MAAEEEARREPGVAKEYRDERIAVYWDARYCIHVANCLRAQPRVFDASRRPWIILSEGEADDIADAVMRCPTGALSFERLDGGAQEPDLDKTIVMTRRNGPLFVMGESSIHDNTGAHVRTAKRIALCRCGGSANKPFCDGTHRTNGFEAT